MNTDCTLDYQAQAPARRRAKWPLVMGALVGGVGAVGLAVGWGMGLRDRVPDALVEVVDPVVWLLIAPAEMLFGYLYARSHSDGDLGVAILMVVGWAFLVGAVAGVLAVVGWWAMRRWRQRRAGGGHA